jgi:3-oxoacyl-ACP reductase-like protein
LQAAGEAAAATAATAAAAPVAAAPPAPPAVPSSPLLYSGVIFDMDGTLTVSNIDYVTMRKSTEIPVGDLFTVMESWDDGDRIK